MHLYCLYFELKNQHYEKTVNGNTVFCESLQDLIFQLRLCIEKKAMNVKIVTIENVKPSIYE